MAEIASTLKSARSDSPSIAKPQLIHRQREEIQLAREKV